MKYLRYTLIIVIVSVYLMFSYLTAFAIGSLGLGEQCSNSRECGQHMGCRPSDLGDYKVCKFSVPNAKGCAGNFKENICTDGMECKDNRCKLTYGIKNSGESNQIDIGGGINWENFSRPNWDQIWNIAYKSISFILATTLLIGGTLMLKGYLVHHVAIGFIPEERRGWYLIGIGSTFFVLSVFVWYFIS